MWPILFCSIMALAITIHKAVQFKILLKQLVCPAADIFDNKPDHIAPLLDALEKKLDEKEVSLIGAGVLRVLEKGVGSLSLIAAITPLLGLTGTVLGMIASFRVIAAHGSGLRVEMLANGIWEALITTAAGLLVAIPVEVAYYYLEERLDEIAIGMKRLAMHFNPEKKDGI